MRSALSSLLLTTIFIVASVVAASLEPRSSTCYNPDCTACVADDDNGGKTNNLDSSSSTNRISSGSGGAVCISFPSFGTSTQYRCGGSTSTATSKQRISITTFNRTNCDGAPNSVGLLNATTFCVASALNKQQQQLSKLFSCGADDVPKPSGQPSPNAIMTESCSDPHCEHCTSSIVSPLSVSESERQSGGDSVSGNITMVSFTGPDCRASGFSHVSRLTSGMCYVHGGRSAKSTCATHTTPSLAATATATPQGNTEKTRWKVTLTIVFGGTDTVFESVIRNQDTELFTALKKDIVKAVEERLHAQHSDATNVAVAILKYWVGSLHVNFTVTSRLNGDDVRDAFLTHPSSNDIKDDGDVFFSATRGLYDHVKGKNAKLFALQRVQLRSATAEPPGSGSDNGALTEVQVSVIIFSAILGVFALGGVAYYMLLAHKKQLLRAQTEKLENDLGLMVFDQDPISL